MPRGYAFEAAAALPLAALTAYHLLKTGASVRAGESVLIHAAASGVGTPGPALPPADARPPGASRRVGPDPRGGERRRHAGSPARQGLRRPGLRELDGQR